MILEGLRGRELDQALAEPKLWAAIREESKSANPNRLVSPESVELVEAIRRKQATNRSLSLFFSTDDVLIIPGFLGSELDDVTGPNGVIWIDPGLLLGNTAALNALRLKEYEPGKPELDATPGVEVHPNGAIPLIYGILKYDLEVRRYSARIFGVDWRKDLEESALALAKVIRARADERFRPLHVVAHSQGTMVARRALQLLGADLARQLVKNLVLLGPATAGSFSAITALTGNHAFLEMVRRWGIAPPFGFDKTLQSMSGLYQLIPWRSTAVGRSTDPIMARPLEWVAANKEKMKGAGFWSRGIEPARLEAFLGWGEKVDTSFFNDRTSIILGDVWPTVGGVKLQGDHYEDDPNFNTTGDGTVPDALALISGVSRVYKVAKTEHMMLPASPTVVAAVRDILADRTPRVESYRTLAESPSRSPFPILVTPRSAAEEAEGRDVALIEEATAEAKSSKKPPAPSSAYSVETRDIGAVLASREAGDIPPPAFRSLRVYSFDPLMATEIESLGTDQLILELPWEFADGNLLQPGPVGDYVEVIDCDPASECVYPPVDLNHPHILAQSGLPASEGDPRFHQQMVYAVAMNTIRQFELALGRKVLWSARLERDEFGRVKPPPPNIPFEQQAEREFVQRLRIYPHAIRQPNAYYHPDKKALLFGYFPATGGDGDRNIPGATVFTCLSHDVVAHETTHAILDGMHRYFVEPSNPDVFAFHEAFADIVALFLHFSHRDVLISQLAQARGELSNESKLGILAAQFGEATGHCGALRQYLARFDEKEKKWKPIPSDRNSILTQSEPHARGGILVAALFRGFTNIYEDRVKDLRRIASGGTGLLPAGDLHPDLVARMADEAAKAARHLLNMCIRALDYVPPVDVTFGDFLRAIITADYDLVRDDDRRYRVSVLSAFRDWGIYPRAVRSLSVDNLLWSEPDIGSHPNVSKFLDDHPEVHADDWDLNADRRRAYERMKGNAWQFHNWLAGYSLREKPDPRRPRKVVISGAMREWIDRVESFGLVLDPYREDPETGLDVINFGSIRRDVQHYPVFEVHSFRPCRRIGPDGQQRTEFVVEIVQKRMGFFDPDVQQKVDRGDVPFESIARPDFWFRGGCTLLVDNTNGRVRYCIQKPVCDNERLDRERTFRLGTGGDGLGGAYLDGGNGNPFAFLHE